MEEYQVCLCRNVTAERPCSYEKMINVYAIQSPPTWNNYSWHMYGIGTWLWIIHLLCWHKLIWTESCPQRVWNIGAKHFSSGKIVQYCWASWMSSQYSLDNKKLNKLASCFCNCKKIAFNQLCMLSLSEAMWFAPTRFLGIGNGTNNASMINFEQISNQNAFIFCSTGCF